MAIKKTQTWKSLTVTDAVLRIKQVKSFNGATMKGVIIVYEVYPNATAYGNSVEPLYGGSLRLDSVNDATAWGQFLSKMREVNEDLYSASYIAVKQLADWTGATDEDLGDEI